MRSIAEMVAVAEALEAGEPVTAIARRLEIPRPTVDRWRRRPPAALRRPWALPDWRPPHANTYAYLLGLYLGDGHIYVDRRGRALLRVHLDALYDEIVEDCVIAIALTTFGGSVQVLRGNGRAVRVQSCWKGWPIAFPQHGRGRKHERPIVLADWQREIVDREPAAFVRGLIHSDGCRTVNRFRTTLPSGRIAEYAYPRYFFSNLSPDIRALFVEACAALGVRCTLSNPRNVSVSHRASVAVLEEVVGPKR